MHGQRWMIILLAAMLAGACSKEKNSVEGKKQEAGASGVPANWKFRLPQGDPAAGRTVFVEMECYKCHEVKGENFPGVAESEKGVGPELSQMGAHPVEFLAESIINPNAVIEPEDKELGYLGEDGRSKVPDFGDILTIKQVRRSRRLPRVSQRRTTQRPLTKNIRRQAFEPQAVQNNGEGSR